MTTLLLGCSILSSQSIVGVRSFFDDSFIEWELLSEDIEDDGKLEMTWQLRNDWSEWDFNFGRLSGNIELRNKNNPENWEMRDNQGNLITMRTVWTRDLTQWKISDGRIALEFKTRYNNIGDEWIIQDKNYGDFIIFTEWEGDPRDWIIDDYLSEEVSQSMKIAIIHIALINSIPKI